MPVHLHAKLTEIGTLDIWCSEAGGGDRQWKLAFDVRSATRAGTAAHGGAAETQGVLDESAVSECRAILRSTFAKNACRQDRSARRGLSSGMESALDISRHDWPTTLLRELWQTLIELASARRLGVEHEARWLSLTGFCLRPGFGLAVDDWRVAQTWRLFPASVAHPKNESCRAEWWILWRRIAGGLPAGQQMTLAEPLVADWRTWARKAGDARGRLVGIPIRRPRIGRDLAAARLPGIAPPEPQAGIGAVDPGSPAVCQVARRRRWRMRGYLRSADSAGACRYMGRSMRCWMRRLPRPGRIG